MPYIFYICDIYLETQHIFVSCNFVTFGAPYRYIRLSSLRFLGPKPVTGKKEEFRVMSKTN